MTTVEENESVNWWEGKAGRTVTDEVFFEVSVLGREPMVKLE